jgi:hypothetical protein
MIEPSEKAAGLMANERDTEGNSLCPVCHGVIHTFDRSPFMGNERVHERCWSSPLKPWNQRLGKL